MELSQERSVWGKILFDCVTIDDRISHEPENENGEEMFNLEYQRPVFVIE